MRNPLTQPSGPRQSAPAPRWGRGRLGPATESRVNLGPHVTVLAITRPVERPSDPCRMPRPEGERSLLQGSSGTFADVHFAVQPFGGLNRIVAVKVLKERWVSSDVADQAEARRNTASLRTRTSSASKPSPRSTIMESYRRRPQPTARGGTAGKQQIVRSRIAEALPALAAAWFKVPIGHLIFSALSIETSSHRYHDQHRGRASRPRLQDRTVRGCQSIAKTAAFHGSLEYMSPERREGRTTTRPTSTAWAWSSSSSSTDDSLSRFLASPPHIKRAWSAWSTRSRASDYPMMAGTLPYERRC